jgi:hypothetical protein
MGSKDGESKNIPAAVSGIADALFSKVQQRVLAVLFGNHSRSFYANELIALAGSGSGAVQRELTQLSAAGLVTVTRIGNQKHYQANASAPVFEELRGLVLKTSGLVDVRWKGRAAIVARLRDDFDGPMRLGMRAGYGYRELTLYRILVHSALEKAVLVQTIGIRSSR